MFPAPKAWVGEMYRNSSKSARKTCLDGKAEEDRAISGLSSRDAVSAFLKLSNLNDGLNVESHTST